MRQSTRDKLSTEKMREAIEQLEAREGLSEEDKKHLEFLKEILEDVETRKLPIDLDDRFVPPMSHCCSGGLLRRR